MPRKGDTKLNEEQLRTLMRLKPTLKDAAAFFKVSTTQIERWVHIVEPGMTYVEFREQNSVNVRLGLVRKAVDMAMSGDKVMLIFALKNLCNWADNVRATVTDERDFTIRYSPKHARPSRQNPILLKDTGDGSSLEKKGDPNTITIDPGNKDK